MNFTARAKDEIEHRINDIEDFINSKGLGSGYLTKAKKTQRNVNVALFAVGAIAILGATIWALSDNDYD